jgi:Spy/CpxP family protein refolding chaperone
MKNMKTLSIALSAAILAAVVALPKLGHADGLDIHAGGVNVDIHDGDHHRHHEEHHWLRHEEMDAALGQIREARKHLDLGGHDFGGHRMRAIKAADRAIEEIIASIEYANHHER